MPVIRRVPQDYGTIALAHAAASNGDIIYIASQENAAVVTITKAVHLVGAGGLNASVSSDATSFGINVSSGNNTVGVLNYNLSSSNAASVPYLLLENLRVRQTFGGVSGRVKSLRLLGSVPAGGLYINRCELVCTYNQTNVRVFEIESTGWVLTFDRCVLAHARSTAPIGEYTSPLTSGVLNKCLLSSALQTEDNAENWTTKDVVTTATTGYGTTPTDGIALRLDDLDFETYRIYGTVTDIPNFVTPDQFEIRLYPEKTLQGNDMGFAPLEMIPLSLIETIGDKWSGSWEFNYLMPTRRYGVLINPPDGMQGHWLRWYNPAVE